MKNLLFVLFLLSGIPLWAETPIKVGLVPVGLEGDYQPLSPSETNDILFNALKEQAPDLEFVLIENAGEVVIPNQASAVAKQAGVELILWGDVRYKLGNDASEQPYYRGRLKIYVSTEADLQGFWVPEERLVLTEPTWVSTNQQTRSWVTGGGQNLSIEQKLAGNSLVEVAKSLVQVLRKREQAGWFHH